MTRIRHRHRCGPDRHRRPGADSAVDAHAAAEIDRAPDAQQIFDREDRGCSGAAQGVDKKLITAVTVFDVYEGKGIEPGKKSIAIAITIQPREKTLTDQEIDAVAAKIVAEVTKKTGGVLRA